MGHLHRFPREARVRVRWAALRSAILLSVLFMACYGLTNWFTSTRSDTRVWMYEWERVIPFVPLMIVPYMSIDAFFVIAPFLCTTRRELRTLSRRIILAILVACAIFLIMPLRLGVARPPASGLLGAFFDWFRGLDHPHNLFPSLHITLRTILAATFARHARGMWRWLLAVWFSLIGFSTLLTYQHHVIDIVGGFALATVCFYAVPGARSRACERIRPQWRIAAYYGVGAMLVASLACFLMRFEGWILLWPAASLALVSAAYLGVVRDVYRKRRGRISFAARLMLGPVLIGQWLSLQHYRRQSSPWNRVDEQVWIGRRLNQAEAEQARVQCVAAVIDLTTEFSEPQAFREAAYLNLQMLDLTAPSQQQIVKAIKHIERHAPRGPVYVHCKAGYSRSAAIVGAYLMATGRCASAEAAVALLREVRPRIVVRPEAMHALREFESAARQSGDVNDATVGIASVAQRSQIDKDGD